MLFTLILHQVLFQVSREKYSTGTFLSPCFFKGETGEAVLFASPRKSVDFLTLFSVCRKRGTGHFAVCGQRSGLLALNLASIFEKIAGAKNFIDAIICGLRVINSFCQKMCSDRFAVKEGVQLFRISAVHDDHIHAGFGGNFCGIDLGRHSAAAQCRTGTACHLFNACDFPECIRMAAADPCAW